MQGFGGKTDISAGSAPGYEYVYLMIRDTFLQPPLQRTIYHFSQSPSVISKAQAQSFNLLHIHESLSTEKSRRKILHALLIQVTSAVDLQFN
jgi:hypothetical protein